MKFFSQTRPRQLAARLLLGSLGLGLAACSLDLVNPNAATVEQALTTREGVLKALFATKDRDSVLGTYSIDENGDTTLTDYGLYKVGSDGNPEFAETIKSEG